MIYKETLPFIDIFKFTFLDRTEWTGKLVPFFACSLSSRKLQAEFTYKFNLLQYRRCSLILFLCNTRIAGMRATYSCSPPILHDTIII